MSSDITQTSSVSKQLRVSRRGKFMVRVNEVYLRRDIPCGYGPCILCSPTLSFFNFESNDLHNQSKIIIVLDLPGLLSSLDCVLTSDLFANMLLPHSVISWLQRHSKTAFKKLKTFLELDNQGQLRVFPDEFSSDLAELVPSL